MANMWEPDVEMVGTTWSTPHLALAAFLTYSGCFIQEVIENEYEQAYWVFKDTNELRSAVMLFSAGNASVEPRDYYGEIQAARKGMPKYRKHKAE